MSFLSDTLSSGEIVFNPHELKMFEQLVSSEKDSADELVHRLALVKSITTNILTYNNNISVEDAESFANEAIDLYVNQYNELMTVWNRVEEMYKEFNNSANILKQNNPQMANFANKIVGKKIADYFFDGIKVR